MTVRIPMPRGRFALFDEADLPVVSQHRWSVCNGYVEALIDGKHVSMHRLIMGFPASSIDHIDGDPLNNTRANLRTCSTRQNRFNSRKPRVPGGTSSRYKGVCWNRMSRKWQAGIKVGGKSTHLGLYAVEEDAARAYDRAAAQAFGEFARINFPLAVA